ncbi:MAG TPA: sensor histidine kinase [Gemmatimonadaceae bacterium]|nr:sensor histidine kinase [Gemmatimonadaceae bacterium]
MARESTAYPLELAGELADRLRTARQELAQQWLDRITARVAISTKRVFPSHELLNHVPLLIDGIADYLRRPERDIDSRVPVVAKAMELGAHRHRQGFDAYELLKEYEMLGEIIFAFLAESASKMPESIPRGDFLACWERISQAIELIRQATTSHFLRLSSAQVNDRENRLRKFNRTVAHELKNHISAISNASTILAESMAGDTERKEFEDIIARNAESLKRVLSNLESLSNTDADSRHCRNVLLPEVAKDAIREYRDAAKAKNVDVRIADDLPAVEVDAATVELCLMNYVSNAIKYSDSNKGERWIAIAATVTVADTEKDREVIIRVSDNGIGVPVEKRGQLFQEAFRAHDDTVTGAEGSGLGLSIVRETVESIGGRAWAEFPEGEGSVFIFSLPSRRHNDIVATAELEPTPEN